MSKISLGSFLFNHETQEWSLYKDRLEQWFLANDIGEEADKSGSKRRAILLSSFTEQSYKLVRDLALPAAVGSLDYQGVVSLLDKHFKAKKCGFAERARFHTAVQQQHENLAEWAARVRGLAIDCSFAANTLDETLRDRFVIGMTPGPERDQLFTKELENLTMSKALEISDGVRSARLGAQQSVPGSNMAGLANPTESVHVLKMSAKHNTTDISPSEILFGQSLRCRLDLINPKTVSSSDAALDKIVKDKQCLQCDNYAGSRIVSFEVGELVLVKDYRSQKSNWTQGVIVEKQGNSLFLVRLLNTDQIFRRHKNQMLKYKGEGRSNGNNHQYEVSNTDVTEEVFIPPFVFGQFASTADLSGEEGNTSATIPDCNRSTESLSSSSSAATTVGGTGNIQNDSVAQELESSLHEETETGPTGSGEPPQFMNLPAGTVVQTKEHSKRNRPRIDYRKYF